MAAEEYIDVGRSVCAAIAKKLFAERGCRKVVRHIDEHELAAYLTVAYAMGAEHGEKVGRGAS